MVVEQYKCIEKNIADILRSSCNRSCPDFFQNRNVCLFSHFFSFNAVEMAYVFIQLQMVYDIELRGIDWENDDIFTFDGLCNLVKLSAGEKNPDSSLDKIMI